MSEEREKYFISEKVDLLDSFDRNMKVVEIMSELLILDMGETGMGDPSLHKDAVQVIHTHTVAAKKDYKKLRELENPQLHNGIGQQIKEHAAIN